MTLVIFAALCVAGGIGAALRFVVDGLVRARVRTVFPFGTAIINISGSLVLGILVGLSLSSVMPVEWELVFGTGMMGGYTTFSTATVETMRLVQNREYRVAFLSGFGVLILTVLAALLGLWLGSLF